jgi:ABC-2 type transport system permease protein
MFSLNSLQLQTFWQLMVRSFVIYKPLFKDKIINSIIWTSLNVVVVGFIMPTVGLQNFGPFILIATAASNGFFTATNQISGFVTEVLGETSNLQYELTLPIPQWLVFAKYALEYTYEGFISTILVAPVGMILLGNKFEFHHFYFVKFHAMLLLICFFSGFFALWMSSITKDIFHGLENLWLRIIFPLWFLGGFQFSWKGLYSVSPALAYINLLNPLTYAMEGSRAAALDPALSLPYWNCVLALMGFTVVFGCWGIYNLKRRMDCL